MIPGLTAEQARLLHQSVGWGRNKQGRPLSPIEVGDLFARALGAGATLQDCADAFPLSPSNVGRFVQVAGLPSDIRHLVAWGHSREAIGFTTAVEVSRVADPEDQRSLVRAVLERDMTTSEVRQAAQLRRRASKSMADCIDESIGMRPQVEKKYVFVGAVSDESEIALLRSLSQRERNDALAVVLRRLGLGHAAGTLGTELFTLVGDESAARDLAGPAASSLEARVATELREVLSHA